MLLAIEFTTGRIAFSIFFIICFSTLMVFSYKKDSKNNAIYYRKTARWVALAIVITLGLLVLSKHLVKTYQM